MKINVVKFIVAIIIAMVIGVICYYIAPEADNRKWISFGVSALTIGLSMVLAIGFDYSCGNRNMNIKLMSWISLIAVIICNIVFSCFNYPILIYAAITVLLSALGILAVHSLIKPKEVENDKK